jgi:PAS domain S-box-containing protein
MTQFQSILPGEKYKAMLECISEIFFTMDSNFILTYWNKTAEKLSGITFNETIGKSLFEFFPLIQGSEYEMIYRDVLAGNTRRFDLQYPRRRGDGYRHFEVNAYPLSGGIAILARDITEYKKNEISKKLLEDRYKQTLDNMIEGCAIFDCNWEYLYVNEANAVHAHHTREELLGKKLTDIFPGIESTPFFKTYKRVMDERIPQQLTSDFIFPDGSKNWYDVRVVPVPEGIYIQSIDVTQRKKDEENLLHYQNMLMQSEELAHVGSWWIDAEDSGNFISNSLYWSDEVYRIFGYMPHDVTVTQDLFYQHVHPDDREKVISALQKSVENKSPFNVEHRIIRVDNAVRVILEHGILNYDDDGNLSRLVGAVQDITYFREAENEREKLLTQIKNERDKLKVSLKEKEILLRELYHRTKNNMQVISSVMSLKANASRDKKVTTILEEMQNRVRTIALVHQKLYQSKNLSRVDLKDYITDLLKVISSAYSVEPGKFMIKKKLQEINVLIDTAIPCGLVINELVSNACKYAFPGDRKGIIRVNLSRLEDQRIELTVSDNGIGMDRSVMEDETKLGLKLFQILAEDQLQAETKLYTENGVRWVVRFKDSLYEARV